MHKKKLLTDFLDVYAHIDLRLIERLYDENIHNMPRHTSTFESDHIQIAIFSLEHLSILHTKISHTHQSTA